MMSTPFPVLAERIVQGVGSTSTGVLLALISAMCVNLGKVCQKRGTQDLPMLVGTSKVLRAYFAHPWWVFGFLLDVVGGFLTLAAVAHAPISVVQPILGCGLAFVAIFSHYITSERLSRRDSMSCLLCISGTVAVGATSTESTGREEVLAVVAMLLLLFFFLIAAASEMLLRRKRLPVEAAAAVTAGICFGLSACSSRVGMLISTRTGSSLPASSGVLLSIGLTAAGFVAQTRG
eukprot:CAMPEP_0172164202 /NCGR_PEP_ID=MMETSP1050-20130122/7712_1 /TAXON_ID=233186 /ORGANISM="Cryptomonas curvata, Strain CCAP979/52" /LENGTH=233 /DNA_ID=CAMNT_0012834509 /DNA_START=181 /DNA_END=878 /DNA_ORIENTATION=+